jgi:hypothetical protein
VRRTLGETDLGKPPTATTNADLDVPRANALDPDSANHDPHTNAVPSTATTSKKLSLSRNPDPPLLP